MNSTPYNTEIIQDTTLLHSLANFREIFSRIIEKSNPRSICEIGIEAGISTESLLNITKKRGMRYTGIDPSLSEDFVQKNTVEGIRFFVQPSLDVLRSLETHDLYVIDGDHNYYTVYNELSLISKSAEKTQERKPCFILHDTNDWPCGRRDCYYSPDMIPEAERQPLAPPEMGVVPGQKTLSPWGFSGNGEFVWASTEGGDKNGVFTAVEDWLNEHPDYDSVKIPAIFGVTVIAPSGTEWLQELQFVCTWMGSLLFRMEANRVKNYVEILKFDYQYKNIVDELAAEKERMKEKFSKSKKHNDKISQRLLEANSLLEVFRGTLWWRMFGRRIEKKFRASLGKGK